MANDVKNAGNQEGEECVFVRDDDGCGVFYSNVIVPVRTGRVVVVGEGMTRMSAATW